MKALSIEGYTKPTPIQEQSIPVVLSRKDLLACAQTGTGKTAAFALPILQLMHQEGLERRKEAKRAIKTLILTPTRELALQIGENISAYSKYLPLNNLVIFGGVSQYHQVSALRGGIDILVATPGRLIDLLSQQQLTLRDIRYFVIDEADRMLDMGFSRDVKRIISQLPTQRQTLFFSATMPPEILNLAESLLNNPVRVEVTPPATTVELIRQSIYHVDKNNKPQLLVKLLNDEKITTALVFTRTKFGADKVSRMLAKAGISAEAIHGNKSQASRVSTLAKFKTGKIRILVATDIAARGIDINELTHVFNFELPEVPETYVHRIGRTGRAGASGTAISFCDHEEKILLRDIQKLIRKQIDIVQDHEFMSQQRPALNLQPRQAQVVERDRVQHKIRRNRTPVRSGYSQR